MFSRRLLVLILTAAEFGCTKKAEGPKPRYAVVRFENLSGDPSLDWAGRAASEILSVTLPGAMDGPVLSSLAIARQSGPLGPRPPGAPGLSTERAEAMLAGATRLISGYVSSANGKIRISAVVEDLPTGKTVRSVAAEDSSTVAALRSLGQQLSSSASPYLISDANAIRLYAVALDEDASQLDRRDQELREALASDPNFGPAWVALVQTRLFKKDAKGAEEVIAQARANKLDALSAASLDDETAQLHNDKTGAIEAERRFTALSPGDIAMVRTLADREMADGQFAQAAADWKRLADTLADDAGVWNSLGYARSYAGDYAGALQALEAYGKLRPNDPNVQDSMGDLAYSFRKYGEASSHYLQAYAKNPAFLRAGDLYKAAWAKFRAGDKAGADASFAQFKAVREKTNDPTMTLLESDWLYRTGRTKDGSALLRKAVQDKGSGNTPLRAVGWSQLAVWDVLDGDRTKAMADSEAAGPPNSTPLAIIRFSVMPSASTEEWKSRAAHAVPEAAMAPLQRTMLAYALLLDGKPKDALPYWEEVAKATPATDFFSRAILTSIEGKKVERALLPDPNVVNQFGALLNKLGVE